jgi:hypothetical protein
MKSSVESVHSVTTPLAGLGSSDSVSLALLREHAAIMTARTVAVRTATARREP